MYSYNFSLTLQEFEKDTKELAMKWQEFEIKKRDFKHRLNEEREEYVRKIKGEYEKLNDIKRRISTGGTNENDNDFLAKRSSIDIAPRFSMQSLCNEDMRYDMDIRTLQIQHESLKQEISLMREQLTEQEIINERLRNEYNELCQLNDIEFKKRQVHFFYITDFRK